MSVEYKSNLQQVIVALSEGIEANVKAGAVFIHGAIVKRLSGKRSGRFYNIPGSGRKDEATGRTVNAKKYQASAPGEAPAVRTGTLRGFEGVDFDVNGASARVGAKKKYGLWLERGTKKMAPRPFIKPSFDENAEKLRQILTKTIKGGPQ